MKKLLFATLAALALSSTACAQFPTGTLVPSTDKAAYALGETVQLILTNIGPGPVTWDNPPSVIHSCFIFDSSQHLVFDGLKVITPAYYDPFTLLPGHSTSKPWQQNYLVTGKSGQVPPGTYYFASSASFAQFQIVPEPSSAAVLLTGLIGTGAMPWRKRQAA